ncbi:MAG: flagellar motor switch protein FliM [Thermodesulfobacteriota bacterium]|jgi:flagellar motor switch protein FliM
MDKILSQEEIDALVKGIETGKVDTTSAPKVEAEVSPFDFANQDRIIRGRMPTLDLLNDFFARLLRSPLSLMLRKGLDIIPQALQLIKYADFTRTLSVPSSIHVFKMDPLRGHSLLVFDPKLVFSFVDIFLGGTGKATSRIEGRDFSAIESKLIHKVVTVILTELEKVWNTVHPVTVQYIRSEINPQFASIVPPTDLVLIIPFELELDQNSALFSICIPYSTLEPIKAKLYSGYQAEHLELDPGWVERFTDQLKNTEVEIVVELAKTLMPAQKLLDLKVGEILPLGKEASEGILARVQGVPKFFGKAGIYGSNKAFQIDGKIKPS